MWRNHLKKWWKNVHEKFIYQNEIMKGVRVCEKCIFKVKQNVNFLEFLWTYENYFLKIEVKQQIKSAKGRDPDLNISASQNRHEKVFYDR